MSNEFLIAVKPDLFLCQIGLDGTVTGSAYPSKAWRFSSYEKANSTCGRLHKLGHRESVVQITWAAALPLRTFRPRRPRASW